ncbi:MAG: hypothetical protein ACTHJL_09785 [Amnibacterium sp.]
MQRIHLCSGTSFLTADATAEAVLEYAWALAQYGRHDIVRVPTRREDGSDGVSSILLGPATQISTDLVATELAEPADRAFVAALTARTAHLREPMPVAPFPEHEPDGADPAAMWDGSAVGG